MDEGAVLTRETALRLGRDQGVFCLLSEPAPGAPRRTGIGLLLLNAGIMHNVGPSCLYVMLARQLAAAGHVVLRFDFTGTGEDPERSAREEPALAAARHAMDLLAETHDIRRFVIAGICSGAVQSFRIALADPRVVGAAMLNPQGYFADSAKLIGSYVEAEKAKQYLFRVSIRRWDSWRKLLRGQIRLPALLKALSSRVLKPFAQHGAEGGDIAALGRDFSSLIERGIGLLHVYAEEDPGLIELDLVARSMPAETRGAMQPRIVPAADHLFTPLHAQRRLLVLLQDFLADCGAEPRPAHREVANV
jgi:hypothetical protein